RRSRTRDGNRLLHRAGFETQPYGASGGQPGAVGAFAQQREYRHGPKNDHTVAIEAITIRINTFMQLHTNSLP
ncbi:MAG: hypothetical protein ACRBG0_18690, partial [Lewinella sp.]|uniref:hypothetical protein n=1 Tax=Lewinella sp. TaxID=2004506 RepID=UPI003D6B01FE